MQLRLILKLLLFTQILSAQSFTELPQSPPFEPVGNSSVAFSDVNGDGYPDLLITGGNFTENPIAKLYINDGLGNFTEIIDTTFELSLTHI